MRVELRDEARDDLADGAVFYGEQSTGLDEYFLKCLRADLTKLETTFGIEAFIDALNPEQQQAALDLL